VATLSNFDTIYAELEQLDRVDLVTGAVYREHAQNLLADPDVALKMKVAIADRLFQANKWLALSSDLKEDSY
jgi:hypothetical protein